MLVFLYTYGEQFLKRPTIHSISNSENPYQERYLKLGVILQAPLTLLHQFTEVMGTKANLFYYVATL